MPVLIDLTEFGRKGLVDLTEPEEDQIVDLTEPEEEKEFYLPKTDRFGVPLDPRLPAGLDIGVGNIIGEKIQLK